MKILSHLLLIFSCFFLIASLKETITCDQIKDYSNDDHLSYSLSKFTSFQLDSLDVRPCIYKLYSFVVFDLSSIHELFLGYCSNSSSDR